MLLKMSRRCTNDRFSLSSPYTGTNITDTFALANDQTLHCECSIKIAISDYCDTTMQVHGIHLNRIANKANYCNAIEHVQNTAMSLHSHVDIRCW